MAKERFDHAQIEKAAQERWERSRVFVTDLASREKEPYYLLFEFPYPSGDLHIGHWYAYAMPDIYARFKRLQGKNVFFPIGFDAFGLPAENAAIKYGKDPKAWTYQNMETMSEQLRSMGLSVDWEKKVATSDPEYYKWTQWLFGKCFEQGLAERKEAPVKWCPTDATVLANEQVVDGKCERCGTDVEEKRLTQWFMKITDYADRLLKDLDTLNWPEEIKEAQRQWIGKSEGALLDFPIVFKKKPELSSWKGEDGKGPHITVFTTRPDTLFGATYAVIAPEHPWITEGLRVHKDMLENAEEVEAYVEATKKKTERERSENKDKTGVRLEGVAVSNPATKEEIPVFVADYVLASYGTGAVMAVPAHDERDYEFAKKHDLPLRQVVVPCIFDTKNPPQEGFEEVKRDTVIVHLRDTKTGKYALLSWHGTLEGITTAIMGGIEEGQTPEEAARAEIREEAGLENVRIVRQTEWVTSARYCAAHKKQNRTAHAYGFLAEVDGLEGQNNIDAYEQETHTLSWIEEKDMLQALTPEHQKLVWRLLHETGALTGDGYLTNSGSFDGQENRKALKDIVSCVGGIRTTTYRIRDWLVSRQRYWGCPIPVVYDPRGKPHVIPKEHLPWLLPSDVDFTPTGKAPLASSKELHERVENLFGEGWTPEYDTLDTFVDSSWYFFRYLDPANEDHFTDEELVERWMPVKRYSGGSEHTTMHLLYARFFTKALCDLSLSPVGEPFTERYSRGLILGPDGAKMSKSKGNVVNPDEFVKKYGSDAVRAYLAFIGPYNEPGHYPWNLDGVVAMRKFLDRIYQLTEKVGDTVPSAEEQRSLARAVRKVSQDTERFKFNTALSALMILLKDLESREVVSKETHRILLILCTPYMPHLTEHLWEKLGYEGSICEASWPAVNETLLREDLVTIVVQVGGKKRGEVVLSPTASEEEAKARALMLPVLSGVEMKKLIYVPGKIINIVPK